MGASNPLLRSLLALSLPVGALASQPEVSLRGDEIRISRAAGRIEVDGDLADEGWRGVKPVDSWYETRPGDNVEPPVANLGYLAYDDGYLYAGFRFADPDPARIRAPYADRDDITDSIDYGGIVLDARNDGRTAVLFLATPRGIQYDAVQNDATGSEDSSPDFYWDAAGRITSDGWVLEIRIPFSSLRYGETDPQAWGVMLFRNYPRDFRRQFFSTRLPRGGNCFVCRENVLTGLAGLPAGAHWVVAPYLAARQEAVAEAAVGSPLADGDPESDAGVDAKWMPSPDHAFDVTVNPDFSQIESDVLRISANERFALLYQEKRPFFLEGTDLLTTPIQAAYTRAITAPGWGLRGTGKAGATAYTALVSDDRGGGSAIIPGPDSSSFAEQDFSSDVGVIRLRHDLGGSFVGFLLTDREVDEGGFNRVFGPDFQWRPSETDTITGQVLFSASETPDRPDLAAEWDGRSLSGVGTDMWWTHSTRTWDTGVELKAFGSGFRADSGFVPQVGFREAYGEAGYTWHPTGFVSRVRAFALTDPMWFNDGGELRSLYGAGFDLEGRWGSSARIWAYLDRWWFREAEGERAAGRDIARNQLRFTLRASPSLAVSQLSLEGILGEEIDFEGARPGRGATLTLGATFRPSDHIALRLDGSRRWLDVNREPGAPRARLLTAQVERVKATYTFNARAWFRLIGQYERTDVEPLLAGGRSRDGGFAGSALLAYKLNWQSVLFLGYGDDRALDEDGALRRTGRQLFLKLSYALQR